MISNVCPGGGGARVPGVCFALDVDTFLAKQVLSHGNKETPAGSRGQAGGEGPSGQGPRGTPEQVEVPAQLSAPSGMLGPGHQPDNRTS